MVDALWRKQIICITSHCGVIFLIYICINSQSHRTAVYEFRCYDNIQPPMCSYIYINYYIHIYIIIPFIQLYMSLYAAVARRFCESSRPFLCFFEYVLLPTTLITYNISPKPSPNIFPLGGDTPFYLISQRNRRFLPHP